MEWVPYSTTGVRRDILTMQQSCERKNKMKIKHIEAVFDNGDKLILTLKQVKFFGYTGNTLYELFYAERVEGRHDDDLIGDILNDGDHYFNVHQTEYFPETQFDKALYAFNTRLECIDPTSATEQGFSIDDILEKE